MHERRVVITGIGIVSPLGKGKKLTWERIKQGQSGISYLPINFFQEDKIPIKVAGIIHETENNGWFINDTNAINTSKHISRFINLGLIAANESILDSEIGTQYNPSRSGVSFGSGIGAFQEIIDSNKKLELGYSKLSPYFLPKILTNLCAGNISIIHNLQGPNLCSSTACAAGAHAIVDAYRMIQSGDSDLMISGASESCISPLAVASFARAKSLVPGFEDNCSEASRPFDKARAGFVISEGSAALVLEELKHAKSRNAKICGEIIGYGLSSDAHHITSPPPDGRGAFNAMKKALDSSNIRPIDVGYINCHATSTPLGDLAEINAIKRLFVGHDQLLLSSTKSMTGHLLGAAGVIEAAFTILALNESVFPPTINLKNPEWDLNFIPQTKIFDENITYALSNSFGFGGTNVSICFSKYDH